MRPRAVGITVVLLALAAAAAAVWRYRSPAAPSEDARVDRRSTPSDPAASPSAAALQQPELEQQYRDQVAKLLAAAFTSGGTEGASFAAVREQVLALTVPGRYRQLHLEVAVALDLVARGQAASDQAAVEEGLEKLQEISEREPWLPRLSAPARPP